MPTDYNLPPLLPPEVSTGSWQFSVEMCTYTNKQRVTTNDMNTYMKTNIGASTYEHRYANEQVETQGFGAFRAHFVMDLLTQEFGKNLGLLFLHNLKIKGSLTEKLYSLFSQYSQFAEIQLFL